MSYPSRKFHLWGVLILFALLNWGLSGCNPVEPSEIPTLTSERPLTPYLTATSSRTPDPLNNPSEAKPVSTDVPVPTPTPFIYTVVANDTLTGIAFLHSIPLEDLIAANPGIDPNFLTIGLTLTIPIEGMVAATLPTPTPVAIDFQAPDCFPAADGSLQCLVQIENTQVYTVENVVVQVTLQSANGQVLATKNAISPLNIIPPGQKSALSVTFEPPLPQQANVPKADLLTVIPVAVDDQRYLQTNLKVGQTLISPDGLQANLTGSLKLLPDQPEANTVWIAAFAYDENENIVGIRKWVANDVLISGEQIEFEFVVYSLGAPIQRVELFTEARP